MLQFLVAALIAPHQGDVNLLDHSLGVLKWDVIELIDRNAEKIGTEAIFVDRYGYRYLFSSDANKRAFLASPQRYEIQLGGACGSMGPLSGRGSLSRYAVHAGKLYLFASDGCRTRFLSNAEKLIDRDAPEPGGDPMQRQAGKDLIDKTVAWCGGAEKIDQTSWYRETIEEDVDSGGTRYHHVEIFAVNYPGSMATISKWNASEYSNISTPNDGFFMGSSSIEPMHPVQRRALERVRDMKLLTILKARARRDFVAIGQPVTSGETSVEIWFGGSGATLTLNAATGKPISLKTVGRGSGALIGEIEIRYASFGELGGLRLPFSWEATFDGKPSKSLSVAKASIALDGQGISFARPAK